MKVGFAQYSHQEARTQASKSVILHLSKKLHGKASQSHSYSLTSPLGTCVLFMRIYKAIQVMLMTMSMPIFSAPSHLYE